MPIDPISPVEKLTQTHDVSQFDCGNSALNDWLQRYALQNQNSDGAVTYVIHRGGVVIGYFALAAGAVEKEAAPQRIARGLARHDIPVILLARLAVDKGSKGQGFGKALLKDALKRALSAADAIGVRAVLVHALDDEAKKFYEHFQFEASPVDSYHLMLLMKDLRASIG